MPTVASKSAFVAWIDSGATLPMTSGVGLFFDGATVREVAGGGLDPSEDHTID